MKKNEIGFKGKFLKIVTKKTKLPNGHISRLEFVEHPGAVLIIPFFSKSKIVLLKQYRPVIQSYIYELPAGTLEKNETPLQCARREIIEETGYAAKKMNRLGRIYPVPGYSTEVITIYAAEGLTEAEGSCETDEVITTHIVGRAEVKELLRKGKLVDAKTICAFTMCEWL